jgi:peptide/nickel transport system permease protein
VLRVAKHILRRLILLGPSLLVVSFFVFLLMRLIPGDPALVMLGEHATQDQIARFRAERSLDRPIWVQYLRYVEGLARGDWGRSIRTNLPVVLELAQRLPATIELSAAAMIIACALGIPLGMLAAHRRNAVLDWIIGGGTLVGVSMPLFWLGLLLSYLLGYRLGWLPPSGRLTIGVLPPLAYGVLPSGRSAEGPLFSGCEVCRAFLSNFYVFSSLLTAHAPALIDALRHLVLPSVALSTVPLAVIVRMTRSCVLEALADNHVRTARAKGLSEAIVLGRHAVRNAWPHILTVVGLQVSTLLSGAVTTEIIFSWPGLGQLVVDRVLARDYPVVQGAVLAVSLILVMVNTLVDIACVYLDPRIRYG